MSTKNDLMIISTFIYALLEGELLKKLVGWEFQKLEEMIQKIKSFFREEVENSNKAQMEGKISFTTDRKNEMPIG